MDQCNRAPKLWSSPNVSNALRFGDHCLLLSPSLLPAQLALILQKLVLSARDPPLRGQIEVHSLAVKKILAKRWESHSQTLRGRTSCRSLSWTKQRRPKREAHLLRTAPTLFYMRDCLTPGHCSSMPRQTREQTATRKLTTRAYTPRVFFTNASMRSL